MRYAQFKINDYVKTLLNYSIKYQANSDIDQLCFCLNRALDLIPAITFNTLSDIFMTWPDTCVERLPR